MLDDRTARSRELYDAMHGAGGFFVGDGTYEVVAELTRGLRTLDVGCGEGWIESINPDVVGVDFSPVALQRARENGAVHLVEASAEDLPFEDNSFDLVCSLGCLEHFSNPVKALSEMGRVSRMQLLTVHQHLPIIGHLRKPLLTLRGLKDQPIEEPFSRRRLRRSMHAAGLVPVFEGHWRYIDLRYLWSKLPYGVIRLPSHIFVMSVSRDHPPTRAARPAS